MWNNVTKRLSTSVEYFKAQIEKVSKYKNKYKNKILMANYHYFLQHVESTNAYEESLEILKKYQELIDNPYDDIWRTIRVLNIKIYLFQNFKSRQEVIDAYDELFSYLQTKLEGTEAQCSAFKDYIGI